MLRKLGGLILLLGLACAPVTAAEILEVRGIALGASSVDLIRLHPDADCRPSEEFAGSTCFIKGYGGAESAVVMYSVVGETVESVTVIFDASEYGSVCLALRAKFGAPTEEASATVENAMGASFENRTKSWTVGTHTLKAEERAGRVNKSAISLTSADGKREAVERFKAKRAEDALKL